MHCLALLPGPVAMKARSMVRVFTKMMGRATVNTTSIIVLCLSEKVGHCGRTASKEQEEEANIQDDEENKAERLMVGFHQRPPEPELSPSLRPIQACSDLEFREVANRLRDWFKALHESGSQNKKTKALLRPERSRFDTSILPICKDSLGWMFNRLDTNYDLLLDQSELGSIYLDKNEQCTKAFFNSCDTYKDSLISNNEWCYCFQRQQDPPCQTELSNIQKRQGVKKLLGQYIPLCDEDGYYKPTQCHGSVGQCWCVDRYGNEVMGSRTNGVADCAIDFETSGDFASGDFHEWTDDEDDEDDIMNDEDEIEDDHEDEGDDDDDGDDHDGYI
ncbi:testican-3-like [Mustela erminea]|uniref:testican-3-like n=1 Tax=Mustela erminea TaxID=36723 RepID=UPI001386D477|nr:testican-3-like [Mustela erminea]